MKRRIEYLLCEILSNYSNLTAQRIANHNEKPEGYAIIKIPSRQEDPTRLTP